MTGRGGEMGAARLSCDTVALGANSTFVRRPAAQPKKQPPLSSEGGHFFVTGRGGEMGAARLSCDSVALGANSTFVRRPAAQPKKTAAPVSEGGHFFVTGRGGEIRTRDPHNPIVVRYQAALRPDRKTGYAGTKGSGRLAMILAALLRRK